MDCLSFVVSVCLSVHQSEQLGSDWTDFHEISYLSIFSKCIRKINISLKSDNNKEYSALKSVYIFLYLAHFFLEWKMFQPKEGNSTNTFYAQ